MRFLLLTFLSVLVSCGQGGSSSSSSKKPGIEPIKPTVTTNQPQAEEYAVVDRPTDLLDVAMDLPVEVNASRIVFKQSAILTDNGEHSTCKLSVTSGESYGYTLNGAMLTVSLSSGETINFKRESGDVSSIVGSWSGKSVVGDQTIIRRITFLTESRLIMRNHCES